MPSLTGFSATAAAAGAGTRSALRPPRPKTTTVMIQSLLVRSAAETLPSWSAEATSYVASSFLKSFTYVFRAVKCEHAQPAGEGGGGGGGELAEELMALADRKRNSLVSQQAPAKVNVESCRTELRGKDAARSNEPLRLS